MHAAFDSLYTYIFFLAISSSAKNPPVIIRHPESYIVPDGYPLLSLRVEVLEQPVTYQWYKDGFVLVQQTRAELNFQPFHYRDEGNYCCRVENSAGDALSNVATLQGARGRSQDIESYLGIDLQALLNHWVIYI